MVSASKHIKPWLNPQEQVEHLKSKGVRFGLISENEAIEYLSKNSNYFRLRSYRTGFPKVDDGPRKGEYANLDFKMLIDLSIVDMLLRFEMLPMTLDIEHFAKVRLLQRIEAEGEDGYEIVESFLREDAQSQKRIKRELDQCRKSPYIKGIVEKYPDYDFPVWAFLELLTFGSFAYFHQHCARQFNDKEMSKRFYALQSVRSIRNACAHNNCILNELASGKPMHQPQKAVSNAISKIDGIGKEQRKSKLNNDRMQEIATTLYTHSAIVSPGVKLNRANNLHVFTDRMNKHVDYYRGNYQVSSAFDFITKLINAWFPLEIDVFGTNSVEGSEPTS